MKVLITGNGLVANALKRLGGFHLTPRSETDLTDQASVESLFDRTEPDVVIHTAAEVGGIGKNAKMPETMYTNNVKINTNVIHCAAKHNVKKLLALSSVCVFSGDVNPLREQDMHVGEPYQAEYAYGFSKRAMDIHIKSVRHQYGLFYTSLILTNLFGKHDNYSLQNGHVIPSLIHKMYLAKDKFSVWGTGKATREFLYADDLARIIMKLMQKDLLPQRIIVSNDEQLSIKDVVDTLCKIRGFTGEVLWETDKPEGQKSRKSDLSVLKSLIDFKYTEFHEAMKQSYNWFVENYESARK